MNELKHDWLTDGIIDYEFKKYILLAYLKTIREKFDQTELYPFLSDLVFHYKNLLKVKSNKELIYESFPKTITKADFRKLKFSYKKLVYDGEVMSEIEDIISFAIPKMEQRINEGKELYEFVEDNLELSPIGLIPIYKEEGYLLLHQDAGRDVTVFRYQLKMFEKADENYRAISTEYLGQEMHSISRTFESIKLDLVKKYTYLPNPATYLVVSKLNFPVSQTVLPIAKRLLVRHLSVAA
ncbi:MAG: hypothetical protein RIA62_11275 [Cyclobacteriaceae bacterium]|tara:strand:+ start:1644 stop:2360 length:717 start_codon:yes stop_codon:yes gene_type:complete